MGFSVSGSAALVFAALLIAFGMWHSAATDSFERTTDAEQFRADDALAEGNTEIAIDTAGFGADALTVELTNTGATTLSLNATEILVDNDPRTEWQGSAELDGSQEGTDLWLPGEQLRVEFDYMGTAPDRVKVVTERGVSDATEVTT